MSLEAVSSTPFAIVIAFKGNALVSPLDLTMSQFHFQNGQLAQLVEECSQEDNGRA